MGNKLFNTIVKNIEHDVATLNDNYDEYISIIEQDDTKITVYDALDSEIYSRTYTIHNPEAITSEYVKGIVLFSQDALSNPSIYRLNTKAIIDYIANDIDKNMMLTIKKIVFVTDEEEETDTIFQNEDISYGLEAGHSFPNKKTIGIRWWDEDIILINIKAIQENIQEYAEDLMLFHESQLKEETSIGIITTLLHEIRHSAQDNPYLPDEILDRISEDDEIDAEKYARNWFEEHPTYVLKD